MRVLMVTNTFPPISGSHVQRMLKMANALADASLEIGVLTVEIDKNHPKNDNSFNGMIDDRITVIRAPIGKLHKRAYSSFKAETDVHYNKSASKAPKKKTVKSAVYDLVTRFKKSVLIPDTMVDWYFAAMDFEKRTRAVKKFAPDVILSCSQPNTAHLIGYELSKMYNIPHFLDYADPWVYLGDYEKKKRTLQFIIGRKLEKRILAHCIGTSYSAPGCRDLYVEKYSLDPARTAVSMSGFEERLLKTAQEHSGGPASGPLTMTYGGALQETVRDPRPFFAASRDFEQDIDVVIRTDNIGRTSKYLADSGSAKCVRIEPYLPFDAYFDEMLSCDLILFFGNNNDVQVPGKIFNCVATGKYILYIKSNDVENDTVEQILSAYGRFYTARNNVEDIRGVLGTIVGDKDRIRQPIDLSDDTIMQFSDREQNANIVRLLNKVTKEK